MDKKAFESLKKRNYRDVVYFALETLRGYYNSNDYLPLVIGVSAIAVVSKELQSTELLMKYFEVELKDETTLNFLRRIEKEHGRLIETLANKYDSETLKATVLFSDPIRFTETAEYSTPEGIIRLALKLLDLQEDDIILDLGSGLNTFLMEAAIESQSNRLYGVEINTNCVSIANIRSFVAGLPITVIQGNIISQDFTSLSANKIFSDFPFGMRLPQIQTYINNNPLLREYFINERRTVNGDWVYTMAAYLNRRQEGRTVVLMTNSGTWNQPDMEIRKKLIEAGVVEGVITLPSRLFTSTHISVTMMVLSYNNKEIRMVDASQLVTEGRRQNTLEENDIKNILSAYYEDNDNSKTKTIQEIAKEEYILNPQRYIFDDSVIADGLPLGELCKSINRGAMIRSTELDQLVSTEKTAYKYLMLQNIRDGMVESNLPYLKEIPLKYQRHCIQSKNLIISKISPFKIAMSHLQKGEHILANGNLYFIEIDATKVNPVYVQVFMQSEVGIAQLNRLARGAVMKSISLQDLRTVKIPNIPRSEQDLIAAEYENLSDELIVLNRQIEMVRDKKAKLVEGVIG